jgi:hypothetical protein
MLSCVYFLEMVRIDVKGYLSVYKSIAQEIIRITELFQNCDF